MQKKKIIFPIRNKFPIPMPKKEEAPPTEGMKGLGDAVAKVAEPIKKVITNLPYVEKLLKDCNCDKRREKLNKLFPFAKAK
jgi:hypothetical protein